MAPKTILKRKANAHAPPKAKKVQLDQPKASSKTEKRRSRPVTALAPPEASGTESEDEEEVFEGAVDDDEGDWEDEDDAMDQDEPRQSNTQDEAGQSNKPPKDPNGASRLLFYWMVN